MGITDLALPRLKSSKTFGDRGSGGTSKTRIPPQGTCMWEQGAQELQPGAQIWRGGLRESPKQELLPTGRD